MTVLRDIAIDPVTRDLVFDGQNFALREGRAAVAQALSVNFGEHEGEWFLDETSGVDYRGVVLVKNPDIPLISVMFRKEILESVGVTGLSRYVLDYDPGLRELRLDFVAETDEGEIALAAAEGTLGWLLLLF